MKLYFLLTLMMVAVAITNTVFSQIDFNPYQTIATGSSAEVVSIADINNDSLNDVIVGTGAYFDTINDYKIFVYLQTSTGELAEPVKYSYPTTFAPVNSITVDDVNNDHLNDVIIGYGDSISIFFQNNAGVLSSIQTFYSGSTVYGLKTGDLNNDGLTDIAVSQWNETFIRIFYQTDSGFNSVTFDKPPGGYDEIDVGDVNSDGLDDVVFMAGQLAGGIHVFIQNNSGSLDPYVSYFPPPNLFNALHGIAIGDLNNDNANDIVASSGGNSPNAQIVIWFQDTISGNLEPPVEIPAFDIPQPIEVADLNCDGLNEIITVHGGWQAMTIYEQDSLGNYNSYLRFDLPYTSHYKPQGLSIGDINDDGRKDIAIASVNPYWILLINNSLPEEFDEIDTAIQVNHIYADTITENSFYVEFTQDTLKEFIITHTDSFLVSKIFRLDSFQIDSVFIRSAVFCSRELRDTLVTSTYSFESDLISCDTTLFSSHIDSVIVSAGDSYNGSIMLNVYPNPTDGIINIELPVSFLRKAADITLTDLAGRLLFHRRTVISGNRISIDLSTVPDGLINLSLTGDDFQISGKIIKK